MSARAKRRTQRDELPPGCRWRPNGTIQYRRMVAGRRIVQGFATPDEAWAFVDDAHALARATALGIAGPSATSRADTVAEVVQWYIRKYARTARDKPRVSRLDAAVRALGGERVDTLTGDTVAMWIDRLAAEPVTRHRRVVYDRKTGAPKLRGPANLKAYLTALSVAVQWHAHDHGYEKDWVNPCRAASKSLGRRGVIASSRRRDRRLRSGEEDRMFAAARAWVEDQPETTITRPLGKRWRLDLAMDLARVQRLGSPRIAELSVDDVVRDAIGRVVAIRYQSGGDPVTVPRRIGQEIEAMIAAGATRLFPVGKQQVSRALPRLCMSLGRPAMLWPALAKWDGTAPQWRQLIDAARRSDITYTARRKPRRSIPMEAIYTFALATGLRRGELADLRVGDVVLNPYATAHVRHAPGEGRYVKTGEKGDRKVPLLPDALRAIAMMPAGRRKDARLFATPAGTIGYAHEAIRSLAGLSDLRFHDLRHEALSRLGDQGYTASMLKLFSGHADSRSLDVYVHGDVAAVHRLAAIMAASEASAA